MRAVARRGVAVTAFSPSVAAAINSTPRTLVIGVEHIDLANQQPDRGCLFEYTDFFSRTVRIHSGDTLDFRTAPNAFHVVGIARSEYKARIAYPVVVLDADDPRAPATGLPRILLGPSNGSITDGSSKGGGFVGGPVDFPPGPCGLLQLGQSRGTIHGGEDVEAQGGVPGFPPDGTDWLITFTDIEPGTYTMFCFIHPGMSGDLVVVKDSDPNVSTQAQIDGAASTQFVAERDQALAVEREANQVRFTGGAPGKRTYQVAVGISAATGTSPSTRCCRSHSTSPAATRSISSGATSTTSTPWASPTPSRHCLRRSTSRSSGVSTPSLSPIRATRRRGRC